MLWLLSGPVVVGLACVAAGLLTLTAKRPLVIAQRWLVLVFVAGFLPGQVALLVDPPAELSLLHRSLGPAFIAVSGLLAWIFLDGYMIDGATEEQLDAAMAEALGRLQQPFEKTPDGMRLTAADAALNARMGRQDSWSLSISPRARRRVLVAVAGGMRAYFGSRNERGGRSGSYAFLVAGAIILLLQLFEASLLGR
jgi:hypothetical protein